MFETTNQSLAISNILTYPDSLLSSQATSFLRGTPGSFASPEQQIAARDPVDPRNAEAG